MEQEKKKVILDVDTGSDDALAIMTAVLSEKLDVVAICTILGNKDIGQTTENTLRVVDFLKRDIPVYQGCADYMVKGLFPSRDRPVHKRFAYIDGKKTGYHPDELPIAPAVSKPQQMDAVTFYLEYLKHAKEKITIIPTGPATNLGIALTLDPSIAENIEQIVYMGGGCRETNISSAAEANVWHDPEAAEKVINCGAEVLLVPMDAIEEAAVNRRHLEAFRNLKNPVAKFAADLVEHRMLVKNQVHPGRIPDISCLCDVLAVCAVIDKSVLKDVRKSRCDVSLSDGPANGQTIIDQRYYTEEKNCYFAFGGDDEKLFEMMYEYFAAVKPEEVGEYQPC
ncbi:nucleoside hydrolase [Diplocloster hominis]|uniref:nucleoside hydrolase n=1 Tax=Diplocloster hominis TaxID=3079010 RepID=UPI0031B9D39D